MRILDFIVSRQKLERSPSCDFTGIASRSSGYLYARFRFSADWKGCKRVAVFSCRGVDTPVAIVNGMCLIPDEALVGSTVTVAVVGKKDGYRITTNKTMFEQCTGV
jgi:hypothetical protein